MGVHFFTRMNIRDVPFSKINNQIFGNHVFFLALDINSKDKKKDEMLNRKSKNK